VSDRLVEALQPIWIAPNRHGFRAPGALGARGIVFGGHLLAQLAIASARTDSDKPISGIHGIFGR